MALSGHQFTILSGDHEATVVEVGAALRRYRHRGADVVEPFDADQVAPRSAGAVLVPWPNRLRGGRYTFAGTEYHLPIDEPDRGNALHGLGRWVRWTPVEVAGDAVTLGTDLVPQAGWPFELRVEVRYALDAAGLTVTTTAANHGRTAAPFGAGFHPYLAAHGRPLEEVTVRVPAGVHIEADEAMIPVGSTDVAGTKFDLRDGQPLGDRRFDDAFAGVEFTGDRGVAEVRTTAGGARLWFDRAFGYLQVFTVEAFAPGRAAVAVEPMTCPADAFNSGQDLIVLDPGATWTGTWGITPL